jgi:hypothetical protein
MDVSDLTTVFNEPFLLEQAACQSSGWWWITVTLEHVMSEAVLPLLTSRLWFVVPRCVAEMHAVNRTLPKAYGIVRSSVEKLA